MRVRAFWLLFAALNGAAAVAAGAYASHGFPPGDRAADLLRLASHYQLVHALALVALALPTGGLLDGPAGWPLRLAGWLFVLGICLFCGALYALVLIGSSLLPLQAPLGGMSFILGWLMLAVAAVVMWRRPAAG